MNCPLCKLKPCRFIVNSGLYFGFLFGILQAIQFYLYPAWWTLPLAGFLVGYITNYLALYLIFRPAEPIMILGHPFQGVFLRRQREVAAEFARMSRTHFLRGDLLWSEILKSKAFEQILVDVTERFCDDVAFGAGGQLALHVLLGPEAYRRMRKLVCDTVVREFSDNVKHAYEYMEQAMGIEDQLRRALAALPPAEFEGVLRPAFEEDEIKLILVGGALGAAVGFLQLVTVFK